HPLVRARRAGAPGDGLAQLHRADAYAARVGVGARVGHGGCRARPRRPRAAHRRPAAHREAPVSVPVIELKGVAFAYPDGHQALFGVELHIHPGERVALLGPNGAGKTTLILHLNGILRPGLGSVTVSGLPVTDATVGEVRRRVGIVFQDPDDQLFMPTVRDDVAFGPANLGLSGPELDARVQSALEVVGMSEFA